MSLIYQFLIYNIFNTFLLELNELSSEIYSKHNLTESLKKLLANFKWKK